MSEIYPVLIGVAATAFVMVLSNVSRRREKDIIELFRRVNQLEKDVSRLGKAVLLLLKDASSKTDNDIDDAIVKMIEEKLFPVK